MPSCPALATACCLVTVRLLLQDQARRACVLGMLQLSYLTVVLGHAAASPGEQNQARSSCHRSPNLGTNLQASAAELAC